MRPKRQLVISSRKSHSWRHDFVAERAGGRSLFGVVSQQTALTQFVHSSHMEPVERSAMPFPGKMLFNGATKDSPGKIAEFERRCFAERRQLLSVSLLTSLCEDAAEPFRPELYLRYEFRER